jgi:hypothetical protein
MTNGKGGLEREIEVVVITAVWVEEGLALRTSRSAFQVLVDCQFGSASSAQDCFFIPFALRPGFDFVTGQRLMAVFAGVVGPAAFHFDGDDVGGAVVVAATSLRIDLYAADFWVQNLIFLSSIRGQLKRQQLFVEAAYFAGAVDEVNLQNPMTLPAGRVWSIHLFVIAGVHVKRNHVAGDFFVWEHADQMAGDGSPIFPSSLLRQTLSIGVQLGSSNFRVLVKVALALGETFFNVGEQLRFQWIVTHHVGAAKVGLPFFEDRAQVEKGDVVIGNGQVGRIFGIGRERISTRADDTFVPVAGDAIHALGQRVDAFIDLALGGPGADQILRLDLGKQSICLGLSI